MKVLAIETSCDETAVSILEASGTFPNVSFRVLGNALLSQAKLHAEYGGVFPSLAKREHAGAIVPLIEDALTQANLPSPQSNKRYDISYRLQRSHISSGSPDLVSLFAHEPGLAEQMSAFLARVAVPDLDAIAVTAGPGLEPALWVGINAAKALSTTWNLPLLPVNHMEGHFLSSLIENEKIENVELPVLGLLISGGHTEFVVMEEWMKYKTIGSTVDDAVGEAFDKTARLLGLPYPGGPQISKLAEEARAEGLEPIFELPRPMAKSGDLRFSFSGLKTAVLYTVQKIETLTDAHKKALTLEFETAVGDVIRTKTEQALINTGAKTFLIGGGVAANTHIRRELTKLIAEEFPGVKLCLPHPRDTGDNAVMIAQTALLSLLSGQQPRGGDIRADGNLSF